MPFDGLVLAAVKKELNEKLVGGRIERVYQPDKDEIVLYVHRPGFRGRLLLSAKAANARVHLTSAARENPVTPPLFCMVLRKYLEGGRIISFTQPDLERVLVMTIDARDELGQPAARQLICEIMGKHSNIILVDPAGNVIIDGIKRYSHAVSRYREVLPGRPYLPPPQQEKLDLFKAGEEQFRLAGLNMPLNTTLPVLLQKCFGGVSTVTCREIVYRANIPPDTVLDQCGDYEFRLLWGALHSLAVSLNKGGFMPCLVSSKKGDPLDFAAIDLTHAGPVRKYGEMNALLDMFFAHQDYIERIKKEKGNILRVLKKEMVKLNKKLALYERELAETAGADKLKLAGELLTANLYRLEKGIKEVSLENYYGSGPQFMTISLEPHRSPAENAQAYFKKYLKAKKTRLALDALLTHTRGEIEYLEGVKTTLEQADAMTELVEIRQELIEQGLLKQPAPAAGKKKKEKARPNLLTFCSSDGFQILAGKNNKQNDFLTLKVARENDLWLHTKDIPGAHIVIRTEGKEVPPATLAEAAGLAAFFSKARESSNVPVDYTAVKNVSKPKGARPGMVIYGQQKTIMAEPDAALADSLMVKDKKLD